LVIHSNEPHIGKLNHIRTDWAGTGNVANTKCVKDVLERMNLCCQLVISVI